MAFSPVQPAMLPVPGPAAALCSTETSFLKEKQLLSILSYFPLPDPKLTCRQIVTEFFLLHTTLKSSDTW